MPPSSDNLQFINVSIASLFNLMFTEASQKSFVLAPEVYQDQRIVSFRYNSKTDGDFNAFLMNFLKLLGYNLTIKNNIYFVSKLDNQLTSISSLYDIYRPKYKDANYLIDNARLVFPNAFVASKMVNATTSGKENNNNAPQTSATALIDTNEDIVLYRADKKEDLDKVKDILLKLDKPTQDVVLKAYIYEVSLTNDQDSAFSIMSNFLNTSITLNAVDSTNLFANSLKISTKTFSLIFQALSQDSNVKSISTPVLRVKSGQSASLNVGQSVPTLGAVSYQGNSNTPVQSIVYQDAGLIFNITPTVKDKEIDVQVEQQISDFANTTTGVNNSPTKTKRDIKTELQVKDSDIYFIAGMNQDKGAITNSRPFILPFFHSNTYSKSKTQIFMLLQVIKADEFNKQDDIKQNIEEVKSN